MKWSSWLRGRLTWKYVAVLVSLVVAALLASGLTEAYYSYQDNRRALNKIHLEKASSAASLIEQFIEVRQQHVHSHALERAFRRRDRAKLDVSERGAKLRVVHRYRPREAGN